jgi:hypothetical protein
LQLREEDATEVTEREVRRILGEQKKHEREELYSVLPVRHTKCQNV